MSPDDEVPQPEGSEKAMDSVPNSNSSELKRLSLYVVVEDPDSDEVFPPSDEPEAESSVTWVGRAASTGITAPNDCTDRLTV